MAQQGPPMTRWPAPPTRASPQPPPHSHVAAAGASNIVQVVRGQSALDHHRAGRIGVTKHDNAAAAGISASDGGGGEGWIGTARGGTLSQPPTAALSWQPGRSPGGQLVTDAVHITKSCGSGGAAIGDGLLHPTHICDER